MDHVNLFKVLFEPRPLFRKNVLLKKLILKKCCYIIQLWFFNSDFNRLCQQFKKIVREENEDSLDYIKYQEESIT